MKILESFTYNPYKVTKMQDKRKVFNSDLKLFTSSIDPISNIKIYAKQYWQWAIKFYVFEDVCCKF